MLKERVKYFKKELEGARRMCRAVEELKEKAVNEEKFKIYCSAVYDKAMGIQYALEKTSSTEPEFMKWMHKFYPDYKA